MELSKCKHVRVRDKNDYEADPEKLIKSLEKEVMIDFRSVPCWKQLVQRIHVIKTDRRLAYLKAAERKAEIAHKMFFELTRLSPFELTDKLARTEKKWKEIEIQARNMQRKRAISIPSVPQLDIQDQESEQFAEEQSRVFHYNTEITQVTSTIAKSRVDVISASDDDVVTTTLPPKIYTNPHKMLSPLGSKEQLPFSYSRQECFVSDETPEEWFTMKKNITLITEPNEVKIIYDDLSEQSLGFSILNPTHRLYHIRFIRVTNRHPFRRCKIVPNIPQKLYPGIAAKYKVVFKLKEWKNEFTTELFFKVSRDVYSHLPLEALLVPVVTEFVKARHVTVPEVVQIPPLYPWHFKRNYQYPSATIEIIINDNRPYHLHIVKRKTELVEKPDLKMSSIEAIPPDFESIIEREDNYSLDLESTELNNVDHELETKNLMMNSIIASILENIIERALDVFLLENCYLCFIVPFKKKAKLKIYFTKIENIGCHSCYYDFLFYDPKWDDIAVTKTMRVFAEILPSPLSIEPAILLDMTDSPMHHGYCEDTFTITNSHKLYPVHVKFDMTPSMKKLFRIIPNKTLIPTTTTVTFEVKFCTIDKIRYFEDSVHFVIKIMIHGHKSVYKNVTPMYYEIIAPCAMFYNYLKKKPTALAAPNQLMI